MILELNVQFADSSDTTFRVMNDSDNQHFTWLFSKQPAGFRFDPDNEVVLKKGFHVNRHRLPGFHC